MTLRADVDLRFHYKNTGTAELGGSAVDEFDLMVDVVLRNGTGTGQANKAWRDGDRSILASASENLDLSGTLTDRLGQPVVFTAIKAIIVRPKATNVTNLVLGAAASNAWAPLLGATGTLTLVPGFVMCLVGDVGAGYAVTAGTGDILKVANGGATDLLYDIAIVGV
jgi:hypothetical protein